MGPAAERTRAISSSEKAVVLSTLEQNQLALKKQPIPRRKLNGREVAILWSLRIYLILMIAVVLYQVWTART